MSAPFADPPKPKHSGMKLLRAGKKVSAMHADEFLGMDRIGYRRRPDGTFEAVLLNERLMHVWGR